MILLLFVSIGSGGWTQRALAQEEERDRHVDFAANIEYIKGHLAQAIENKRAGENTLAIAHAGHPIGEVYSLMAPEIVEHDSELDAELKDSLTKLANEISSLQTEQVESQVAQIDKLLDTSKSAVIPEAERSDADFNARVIISLLGTAELEYEEGVSDGRVVEMIEYQDSAAFIARAQSTYDSIKARVPEHEAEEISESFADLNSATGSHASYKEVEASIDGITHQLKEAFNLESEEQIDGQAIISNINKLLDDSVAAYKAGNETESRALAVEAYLDNYEYIEKDIKEDNPALMEKIELALREELVGMIDSGKPASEIETHVAGIKGDLETARSVVVPEFPVILAVVGATIAAVVVAGRFKWMGIGGCSS
jgi:hypothetical protein